ncbi:hypothetical protein LINPERHAP2_LOCUS5109 [Linum perenne]
MVITGRQRYENGWCFWSEINKKVGRIERDEDKLWCKRRAATFEKKKWKAEEEGRSH